MLDSYSNVYIINYPLRAYFEPTSATKLEIQVANTKVLVSVLGTAYVEIKGINGKAVTLVLKDVCYVPNHYTNIVLGTKMRESSMFLDEKTDTWSSSKRPITKM